MSEPSSLKDVAAGRPESREAKLKKREGWFCPAPISSPGARARGKQQIRGRVGGTSGRVWG